MGMYWTNLFARIGCQCLRLVYHRQVQYIIVVQLTPSVKKDQRTVVLSQFQSISVNKSLTSWQSYILNVNKALNGLDIYLGLWSIYEIEMGADPFRWQQKK